MTNAEARFNNVLRPRKPEGSLGRTAQDGHLDSHTAPELCSTSSSTTSLYMCAEDGDRGKGETLFSNVSEPEE